VIDTGALGDVSIVIKLSNAQPLILSGTAAGADYQLDKLEFSIDIISFDDGGRYYKMLEDLLSTGSPLEIPYQYWVNTSAGPTNLPARVLSSVSSQSIDMIILSCLPATLASVNNVDATTYTSDFFTRGSANITSSGIWLNNVKYPMYDPVPFESFMNSLKAFNMSTDTIGWLDSGMNTLANVTNKYFTNIYRFNHNTSGDETGRVVSGCDSRGTMAQIRGELNGSGASVNPCLFVQCTGVLRLKAFRQIDVVW
jgi:hypothetical protein